MKKWLAAALAAGLTLSMIGSAGAQGPPGPERTLTLVTGDVVHVLNAGDKPVLRNVEPGPGRERIDFRTAWLDGHLHVIPSDAHGLLGDGRVDRRLFDVTQLLDWGYDDASRSDVPVLTERAAGRQRSAMQGARVTRSLDVVGIDAAAVRKSDAGAFWNDVAGSPGARGLGEGVTKLWLDGKREPFLDRSVPQIGAPAAWKQGLTGKGVTTAVIDTGYDQEHPDLRGVVTQAKGFTPAGPSDVQDESGHGTHVASTIAGSGAASGGKYRGVAPDARIAVAKTDFSDSSILAAMEWASGEIRARVINMSLGGLDVQENDPVEGAVDELSAETGALFVISAGNSGFGGARTVASPASADAALSVGAVDDGDALAGFSSRGPRIGDFAVKPDITAPGATITAAVPEELYGQPYAEFGGTSMAAPHVVGAAAILAQRHPDWNGERLKAALMGSAKPQAGSSGFEQGAGRVDVARAVTQDVTAGPGNLSTYLRWPDPKPQARTVTYENDGSRPVRLRLAVAGEAPRGLFRLDDRRVTVPAHATRRVRLTVDPRGVPQGAYSAALTATAGSTVVRSVLGAYVEPEAHELSVEVIGRDGKPGRAFLLLHDQDSPLEEFLWAPEGKTSARLPADRYNVAGDLVTPQGSSSTLVNVPVSLDRDRRIVIDARKANEAEVSLDEPTAERTRVVDVGVAYERGAASYAMGIAPTQTRPYYVLPVRQAGLDYFHHTAWFKAGTIGPDGMEAAGSPFRYDLLDYRSGGIPDDPAQAVRTSDLAKVTTTFRAQNAPSGSLQYAVPWFPFGAWVTGLHRNPLPYSMTEYFTPETGPGWARLVLHGDPLRSQLYHQEPRVYSPGEHTETWNAAAPGAAFARECGEFCAAREGNTVSYWDQVFLFSDAGARDNLGFDPSPTGTIKLTRDGEVLEEAPLSVSEQFTATVPAEPGRYTLSVAAARDVAYSTLSTKVDAEYTFDSERTAERRSLPLMAVRYAPGGLDERNRAESGSTTEIPLWVERNSGAPAAEVESIAVEASGDDGRTWREVEVTKTAQGWTARVENPASGFVSLRAKVTDSAGSEVKQTITRAYAIAP